MNEPNNNVISMPQAQPAGTKFTITAILDGFPVTIELEGKADNLKAIVDKLKAIGAQPPASASSTAANGKSSAPLCPVHNTKMKASRKPGTWYCPRRDDDGEYCREQFKE
jgi:hypothetical protein